MSDLGNEPGRTMPRLAMLRAITDSSVLDEVFAHGRVTRAGLAEATGISGPTAWESVRRLAAAGLLCAAGSRETSGRGRSATYYELATTAGWVLAVSVDQAEVRAIATDLAGRTIAEAQLPTTFDSLAATVRQAGGDAVAAAHGRGRLQTAAMSIANPVRLGTGGREIVTVPGATFPEVARLARDELADVLDAPVLIDNDVNLAALAERRCGQAQKASSFAYAYIGAGLGLAVYVGDHLIRGSHGLAGEIGFLAAPLGEAHVPLFEALAGHGFPGDREGLDVAAILAVADHAGQGDARAAEVVSRFGLLLGTAIVAGCAIVDPELVLLGGPIGCHPTFETAIRDAVARFIPAPPRIAIGGAGESASLRGALCLALDHGRKRLIEPDGAERMTR